MRHIIIFFLLPLSNLMGQEHSFIIKGEVSGLPEGTFLNVMQYSHSTGSTIDSVFFDADTFYLKGIITESLPQRLGLRNFTDEGPIGGIEFWIEENGGPIIITGDGPYLATWQASSEGKEQKALNALNKPLREYKRVMDSISDIRNQYVQAYFQGKEDQDYGTLIKALDAPYDSLNNLCTPIMFANIQASPNSFSAVQNLYYLAEYNLDQIGGLAAVQTIYSQLEAPYTESLYAVGIQTSLNKPKVPEEGDPMVDILARDLSGQEHRLSEFHESGKYMLLDFWSLACGPCILAAPELRAMQTKYSDKLNIVGLSMDTKLDWWQQATERDSITWTNLSDFKGTFGGAAAQYGVRGLPTYVLIDPEGKVAKRWIGYGEGVFEENVGVLLTK